MRLSGLVVGSSGARRHMVHHSSTGGGTGTLRSTLRHTNTRRRAHRRCVHVCVCVCVSLPQVVKQLWVYIKEHNLQDPKDKRTIIYGVCLGQPACTAACGQAGPGGCCAPPKAHSSVAGHSQPA
jgi:hypothetical protein